MGGLSGPPADAPLSDAPPPPPPSNPPPPPKDPPKDRNSKERLSKDRNSKERLSKEQPKEAWGVEGKENAPAGAPIEKVVEKPMEGTVTESRRSSREGRPERAKLSSRAVSKAGNAVFDAHRQFITSCVEQLEVHTFMLSQVWRPNLSQPARARLLHAHHAAASLTPSA